MFIVVEGSENRGKSTIVKELQAALIQSGISTKVMVSPNRNSLSGQKINELLRSKERPDRLILQSLMTINRIEDLPLLTEALRHHQIVIYDRYSASGIVYGHLDGLPIQFGEQLASILPEPDFTFVLYGTSYKAIDKATECYDEHDNLLEKYYIALAPRYKWILINNEATPKDIAKKILNYIGK